MIKIMGLVLISAAIFSVIKKYSPEYSVLVEIAAVVLVITFVYPQMKNVIDFFYVSAGYGGVNKDYIQQVIRIVGIAIVTQFCADICVDTGQSALASEVEFSGKLLITVFTIPAAKALLEIAIKMIGAE